MRSKDANRLYMREWRKKQGKHKPRESLSSPPPKPETALRATNYNLYMKLYHRWYRYHGYHKRKKKTDDKE